MQQMIAKRASLSRPIAARRPCSLTSRAPRPVRAVDTDLVATNGTAHPSPAVVDFDELSDIIRMVHDTDIIELEIKSKKFNLSLKKKEALASEQVVQYVSQPQHLAPPPPPTPAPMAAIPVPISQTPTPAPMTPSAQKIDGIEIVSPMSGTYYRAAAPGEAPFCKPGDKVKKGQVIGIIEAMKLMNEIEAEISGEVVSLLVENGTPVTPGLPLILIRP